MLSGFNLLCSYSLYFNSCDKAQCTFRWTWKDSREVCLKEIILICFVSVVTCKEPFNLPMFTVGGPEDACHSRKIRKTINEIQNFI